MVRAVKTAYFCASYKKDDKDIYIDSIGFGTLLKLRVFLPERCLGPRPGGTPSSVKLQTKRKVDDKPNNASYAN